MVQLPCAPTSLPVPACGAASLGDGECPLPGEAPRRLPVPFLGSILTPQGWVLSHLRLHPTPHAAAAQATGVWSPTPAPPPHRGPYASRGEPRAPCTRGSTQAPRTLPASHGPLTSLSSFPFLGKPSFKRHAEGPPSCLCREGRRPMAPCVLARSQASGMTTPNQMERLTSSRVSGEMGGALGSLRNAGAERS